MGAKYSDARMSIEITNPPEGYLDQIVFAMLGEPGTLTLPAGEPRTFNVLITEIEDMLQDLDKIVIRARLSPAKEM